MGNPLETLQLLMVPAGELPVWAAAMVTGWCFCIGATVGSFLNVVIYRLPRDQKVSEPKRSHCPSCNAQIAWFDNIPVLSWIALRGKCRKCASPIAFRYPFVEALVGLLGVAIGFRFGIGLAGGLTFAFAATLIAIAYIDLDWFEIDLSTLVVLAAIGAAAAAAELIGGAPLGTVVPAASLDEPTVTSTLQARAIGLVAGFGVLFAFKVVCDVFFRWVGRIGPDEVAMGMGDPLLLGGIGLFLGWAALPMVVFLGSAQGALVGIVMKIAGGLHEGGSIREEDEDTVPPGSVPFGPFLALGALEVAFFGNRWLPVLYAQIFQPY